MDALKKLKITLAPWMDEAYNFQYCDVEMTLQNADLTTGNKLADLWVMVAGVPGCELAGDGLQAIDETGILALTKSVEKDPQTTFDKTVWRVSRDTVGDVTFRYRFLPRDVSHIDRCHPYFDVIPEENGCLIPGVTSLVTVEMKPYQIQLTWDKSHMPDDARVAAIKGCDNFDFVGTPMDYAFSLYMAGKIKNATSENGKYNVYWLDEHLPDQEKVIAQLPKLIEEMARFFQDDETNYSIFMRKEPFKYSNGGTAFNGGFAYGYSEAMPLVMEEALNTLAHETVHNWPTLEMKTTEENWYSEGTAEFYSIMVPLRAGIVTPEEAAPWITEKCPNFYQNEYQNLSQLEAYQKAWEGVMVQKVPYGRGFIYLAHVDLQLRQTSEGKLSLDDLVLDLEMRRRTGQPYDTAVWVEWISRELGEAAVSEFEDMLAGKWYIEPNDQWFDGLFTFSKGTYTDIKRGTFEDALIWRAK